MKQTYSRDKICRVQIKLEDAQKEMIKRLAEASGQSISSLILQELDLMLKEANK